IEPIIYERISFLWSANGAEPIPRFLATISSRPASFFATHVKHLYFDHTIALSAVQQVLGVCTGVVSVGCHHPYSRLEHLLAPLPLQRLLLSDFPLPSAPGNLPPWAASLTHLGIVDTLPRDPTAFATLPSLTHLAVSCRAIRELDAVLAGLLRACAGLLCLVLMTESTRYKRVTQRLHDDGFGDPRFYLHVWPGSDGTWDAWSRRVPDMFADAEAQFKGRRAVKAGGS
ncbi:hypothetical protein DFH06DRAFT_1009702, partial [Mycena polygramma]